MPEDIYIAKMTFKCDFNAFNYVQFTMSDGTSSPVIQSAGDDKAREVTLTFEEDVAKNIRSIKGGGNSYCVYSVSFFDASEQKVASYDPGNYGDERANWSYTLALNERLIGFYGTYSTEPSTWYFSNFGFIVRVKTYD